MNWGAQIRHQGGQAYCGAKRPGPSTSQGVDWTGDLQCDPGQALSCSLNQAGIGLDHRTFWLTALALVAFGFCLRDIYEQWYFRKMRNEVRDEVLVLRSDAASSSRNRAPKQGKCRYRNRTPSDRGLNNRAGRQFAGARITSPNSFQVAPSNFSSCICLIGAKSVALVESVMPGRSMGSAIF